MSDKNCSIILLLAILLVMGISGCSDEDSKLDSITFNQIKNEPAITQKDLDAYINILPEIAPVEFSDGKKAAKIYYKFGLSRVRYKYIQAKIPFCACINAGTSFDFLQIPASLKPNDAELILVRDNLDAIDAAQQIFKQKVVR